ncbi:unnamed protein product [Cylindrotheca closterium]|uniref:Uncharacterized protein n=1 Tax=Cylindrotheca closterium TaxID=2856 RepID=A0AAD2CA07_9STRA|nr:unnamed protein product [Cylindrotheca closterium]
MSVGSHRLRELADTELSYPGWENDYEEAAEAFQIGTTRVFERLFMEIMEKQREFDNYYIMLRIEILDDLDIDYPGCLGDKRRIEEWCRENPVNDETQEKFEERMQGLVNKHALYEGDRSHANLAALDDCDFTYPGWEDAYQNAVQAHCSEPFTTFPKLFHQMKEMQNKHEGKRIHWRLKTLDELELSYPGCEKDVAEVETWHFNTFDSPSTASLFREAIDGLLEQEEIYLEAQIEESKERKDQEERGIFIDRRKTNREKEAKQAREPTSDPIERRTPTREERLHVARVQEMTERKERQEKESQEMERREALERQSHSRRSINNFVEKSAPQNYDKRGSHLVAPTESVASEGESSADSMDLEIDRCYRRIAASLQMLEESKGIIEEEDEVHFYPQQPVMYQQHMVDHSSSPYPHHSARRSRRSVVQRAAVYE